RLALQLFEQRIEPLEIRLPDRAVLVDPRAGLGERLRLDPARAALSVLTARDQPRALQHLQVFGDRRLADAERRRQLRHRSLSPRQPREDRAARGIGEGGERGVEALRSGHSITRTFYNSMVMLDRARCQLH